jgi:hypothetical protein
VVGQKGDTEQVKAVDDISALHYLPTTCVRIRSKEDVAEVMEAAVLYPRPRYRHGWTNNCTHLPV